MKQSESKSAVAAVPGIESCSLYLPRKGHTRKPLGSCELSNDFDIKIPIFLVIKMTVRSSELQKEKFSGYILLWNVQ